MYVSLQPVIGSGLRGPRTRWIGARRRMIRGLGDWNQNWFYGPSCGGSSSTVAQYQAINNAPYPYPFVGPMTPDLALFAALQNPNARNHLNSAQFQSCSWYGQAVSDIANGSLYYAGGQPISSTAVTAAVNKIIGAGGQALAPVTLGISSAVASVVTAITGLFTAHHAAAVALEQSQEAEGVSFVNTAMAALIQAVNSGSVAPAAAAQALPTIYNQFMTIVQASWNTSPFCSANCEWSIIVNAMTIYWAAQWNALAATPEGQALTESASLAASTGLPSWAIWAIAAFAVYELVS